MDQVPPDILNYLMNYINFIEIGKLALTCKYFKNHYSNYCQNINKKMRIIHKLFLIRKQNFYDLLNKNRQGYLINFNKIYKQPNKYIDKRIQFVARFEYMPYSIISGEIAEGYLSKNKDETYTIVLENSSMYKYQLLFQPFIMDKSLRVIKD